MADKTKAALGLRIVQPGVKKSLESMLREKFLLNEEKTLNPEIISSLIVDKEGLAEFKQADLDSNLLLPVFYLQPGLAANYSEIVNKNIFRVLSYGDDSLSKLIEIPAKDSSSRGLADIIKSGAAAHDYLLANKEFLQRAPDLVIKWINDEKDRTSKGDYGLDEKMIAEFKKIRGAPRSISSVEAIYQSLLAKELLKRKERAESSILVVADKFYDFGPLISQLKEHNYSVDVVGSLLDAAAKINERAYAILISYFKDIKDYIPLGFIRKEIPPEDLTMILLADYNKIPALMKIGFLPPRNYVFPKGVSSSLIEVIDNSIKDRGEQSKLRKYKPFEGMLELLASSPDAPEKIVLSLAISNLFQKGAQEEWAKKAFRQLIDKPMTHRMKADRLVVYCYNIKKNIKSDFEKMNVISTDVHYRFNPDMPDDLLFGRLQFRKLRDFRRAYSEASALKYLKAHNESLAKSADSSIPAINTKKLVSNVIDYEDSTYILPTEYIEGPTLEEIADGMNGEIASGNKDAKEFKRQVMFEINRYLAYLQVNPIPLPESVAPEQTNFSEVTKKSLIQTLRLYKQLFDPAAVISAEESISRVLENLKNAEPVQYFDFCWLNVMFVVGNDKATFKEVLAARKQEESMRDFVRKTIRKIDFNKIYRKTSQFEDIRSDSPKAVYAPLEREIYDAHFLLCKKKFSILKNPQEPTKVFGITFAGGSQPVTKQLDELIARLEENEPSQELASQANQLILSENANAYAGLNYVEFYRNARWYYNYLTRDMPNALRSRNKQAKQCVEKKILTYLERTASSVDKIDLPAAGAIKGLVSQLRAAVQERQLDYSRLMRHYASGVEVK